MIPTIGSLPHETAARRDFRHCPGKIDVKGHVSRPQAGNGATNVFPPRARRTTAGVTRSVQSDVDQPSYGPRSRLRRSSERTLSWAIQGESRRRSSIRCKGRSLAGAPTQTATTTAASGDLAGQSR